MKSKKIKNHFSQQEEERSTNAFTFIKNRFFITPKTFTYDEKSPRASTSSSRRSSLQLSLDLLLDSPDTYDELDYNMSAKEGYLFKKTDFKAFKDWKLYRVVLRGHKLYLYKPMSSESPLYKEVAQQTKDYDFDREAQEVLFTTPTQGTVFMELDQNMQPTHKVQLVITEQDVTCTRLGGSLNQQQQQQWSIESIKLDYTRLDEEEEDEVNFEEEKNNKNKKYNNSNSKEENELVEQQHKCPIDNNNNNSSNANSDMMSSDSNGPLPFSITINDDAVYYFSTIHRELGQAWISHLQQKLNDLTCSMTSSSTDFSSHNISSSFSSSNNDTDEDMGDDTTLTNLVQTLLFTTDNEFIHVFLTTYSLFSSTKEVLDELKKNLDRHDHRLLGLVTVWCQSYPTDITQEVASGMIALLEQVQKKQQEEDLQVLQVRELVLKTVANNMDQQSSSSQTIIIRQDDQLLLEEELENQDSPYEIENIAAKDKRRDSINMSNLMISGLTPELFLIIDPTAFAEQIYAFHQAQHAKYKSSLLHCLASYLPNRSLPSVLDYTLLFTEGQPHFLTHFIRNQILIESHKTDFEGVLLTRAQLLEQWIRIGGHLLELGDMTGWYAIAVAVCSPCMSRLKETWKAVHRELVQRVQTDWVPILADQDNEKVLDVDRLKLRHYVSTTSLPYFGLLKQSFHQLKEKQPFIKTNQSIDFAVCRSAYASLKSQLDIYRDYDPHWNDFPVVAPIQSFFEHAAADMTSSTALFTNIKYLHECSLVCEPKLLGQGFDGGKKYLSHPTNTAATTATSSTFQFPEILDTYQLLDPLSLMLSENESMDSVLKSPEDEKLTIHSYSSSEPQQVIKKAFHRKRSLSFASSSLSPPSNVDSEKTLLDSLITGQSIRSLAQQSNAGDVVLTVQQGELTFRASFMKPKVESVSSSSTSSTTSTSSSSSSSSSSCGTSIDMNSNNNNNKNNNGNHNHDHGPLLLVSVKAGHLESLVDLLVYGISEYTDQLKDQWNMLSNNNHQLSSEDLVKMDDEDYVTVFFSSYRVFCSAQQLFDLLRKRFLSSKDQGKRAQRKNSLALLENYFNNNNNNNNKQHQQLQQQQQPESSHDWQHIGEIQLRILNLFYYWLEEHYYDFMDDFEMMKLISSFLLTAKKTLDNSWSTLKIKNTNLRETVTMIQNRIQQIHQKITMKSMSPYCDVMNSPLEISREFESIYKQMTMHDQHFNISIVKSSSSPMSILDTNKPTLNQPLSLDDISPESLLDQLDRCVRQAFCAVTIHDWIQMFDVMEAQVGDVYAWLPARKPSRTSRMGDALNLITSPEQPQQQQPHESSVIISDIYTAIEGARRSIVSPSAFSDDDLLLAFPHSIQYLYSLHYVMRYWVIQEIASIHIDVKIRVLRIEKFLQVIVILSNLQENKGKIPNFVEYAIASALVSPEVRLFTKAWNDVAVQHGNASLDTLQNLIYQIQKMQPTQPPPLQHVVPSLGWILERVLELKGKTHVDMINFEQRHYMVDFIHWLMGLQIELSTTSSTLSFQLTATTAVSSWKDLRDFATRESKRQGHRHRPVFTRLVYDQLEKLKRDFKERDRIDKEWLGLQHKLQKKQVEQQIRQVKVIPRLNSFLKGFRREEEDPTVAVISLIGCSTTVLPGKRDFVFRIMTEEGGQYLFQGMSRDDMQDWMRRVHVASREGAAKRQSVLVSGYVAEDLAQTNRHGAQPAKRHGTVYGVSLEILMNDGQGGYRRIPSVVEKCIGEIEKRGLEEVGIYRVAGTGSVVTALKTELNRDCEKVDLGHPAWADINVVADAFKQFLRELPEPLLTYTYYNEFIHASTLEDHDERVYLLKQVVKKLPIPNYALLKRIIEHFLIVTDFESTNHMYATNLAIVFGPTLLQPSPSPSSFATTMANLAHHQNIVKYLVLNYHYLFDVESDDVIVAGPQ